MNSSLSMAVRRPWQESLPRAVRTALLVAPLLVLGVAAASCGGDDEASDAVDTYSGYVVDPPLDVADVTLPRADGSGDVSMAAPEGGLRLVYFGYLSCPDVCPTTLSDVKRAMAELPPQNRNRVEVGLVTVDPARDDSGRLNDYLGNFVEDGDAMRTDDPEELQNAASAFGANYQLTTNDDGEVEVAHTAELYAVDDSGTVVMAWPFGTSHESLARDLESLLVTEGTPT